MLSFLRQKAKGAFTIIKVKPGMWINTKRTLVDAYGAPMSTKIAYVDQELPGGEWIIYTLNNKGFIVPLAIKPHFRWIRSTAPYWDQDLYDFLPQSDSYIPTNPFELTFPTGTAELIDVTTYPATTSTPTELVPTQPCAKAFTEAISYAD